MASPNIHVVPAGDDGWAVEEAGGRRRAVFRIQHEAIVEGTVRAKKVRAALLIHGRDGKIHAQTSFGHDAAGLARSRQRTMAAGLAWAKAWIGARRPPRWRRLTP